LLVQLNTWLNDVLMQIPRKSALAEAIRYALTRWTALTHYVRDGRVEIDNNAAERALRATALGRKNYLFVGSAAGGQRAAPMYSLIGSARLTASIRKPICAMCSIVLPSTRSIASKNYYPGTSLQTYSRHGNK